MEPQACLPDLLRAGAESADQAQEAIGAGATRTTECANRDKPSVVDGITTTPEQREALQAAHHLAGAGSLIPAHKTYIQQRHVYDGHRKTAGLSHMHGLRHQYAQSRYEALTGWKASTAGGPSKSQLDATQRVSDQQARQQISRELGHERVQVTAIYLGA